MRSARRSAVRCRSGQALPDPKPAQVTEDEMADSLNVHFLSRKFHSLTGLIPVGAFLAFHLWENSMSRQGERYFNEHVVKGITELLNYKVAVEIFLGAAILFHGIYGLVIWWQGKSNTTRYRYGANWRYLLQRITAFTTFAFIVWHVWTTRVAAGLDESVEANLFVHMQRIYEDPVNVVLYMIGIVGATFHLANGLWLLGVTWGLTTHPRAQKISAWVFAGVFAVTTFLGLHALWGFNQKFF
jgi:succinate dehydrogenase / fumarate reductase cytochrome b subunit